MAGGTGRNCRKIRAIFSGGRCEPYRTSDFYGPHIRNQIKQALHPYPHYLVKVVPWRAPATQMAKGGSKYARARAALHSGSVPETITNDRLNAGYRNENTISGGAFTIRRQWLRVPGV
jgi:hypothetical protein